MKHKEMVSVIVGSAFFAIPYLTLSVAALPSLVIGAAAFGASQLVLSETKKKEEEKRIKRSVSEVLTIARKNNAILKNTIPEISNVDTKDNLEKATRTINKIISTIEKKPNKMKTIDNFFDYYLPVLVNLVVRYDEIENQELSSKEGKKFMASADNMINEANTAFEKILNDLFESDIVDADAEMKVFNSMLKTDGLSEEMSVKGKE